MDAQTLSELYSVDEETAARALLYITEKKVCFLIVSGKIGAGKDTVAPVLASRLNPSPARHEFFARPLKEEVQEVIGIIRGSSNQAEAFNLAGSLLDASNHKEVFEALWEDVKSGAVDSAYQRTPSTRRALQWWGTEVRRRQDENYWVKKAIRASIEIIAGGESIFVTDSRFPNEADAATWGATLVRLDVSPEEQARRILSRDGKAPLEEALHHSSEHAMDDYPFPIRVLTDGKNVEEVVAECLDKIRASE